MSSATAQNRTKTALGARLLVLILAFSWGFNWIFIAFALQEVSPWSLRFATTGIGAASLELTDADLDEIAGAIKRTGAGTGPVRP